MFIGGWKDDFNSILLAILFSYIALLLVHFTDLSQQRPL